MKDIKKILEYAKYTFDEAEKVKEYAKYIDEESEEVKDESQTSSDNTVRRTLNDHISEVLKLNTKIEK
jgi:hypothetical protein